MFLAAIAEKFTAAVLHQQISLRAPREKFIYLATLTALFSLITVTLIWPGKVISV
jgi:hypothetical protein